MKKYWMITIIVMLAFALRLAALDKFPAGLNADEAAIGYNAYSLLKTGMDEHSASWPIVFRSFDDYKPPAYFYLVLPFIKFFGLNIWSVRLPSAILGSLSVLLLYLLLKQIFTKDRMLPVIAAVLLATSPWHLQFSRGGWEVNTALFFILLGLWLFFKGLTSPRYFLLSSLSSVASLYTYHSARIITPLLVLSLLLLYWPDLFTKKNDQDHSQYIKKIKTLIIATVIGFAACLPIGIQLLSKEGQSRFSGVSVFSDSGPLWQALEMRRQHPEENLLVRAIHNKYLSYGLRFTQNYLSHFSPRFLFVNGDEIARSKVPAMGQSYLFLAPFFFIGLLILLQLDNRPKRFIFVWFLISPLAAALTFQSPHALRSQNMVVPLTIITALGISACLISLGEYKNKLITTAFLGLTLTIGLYSVARYLHLYYVHYPKELPYAWQYGFDQIADYIQQNYNSYDKIIITDRYDQPYILMAFFLKYPPATLQKELVMTPRDKFGFSTVKSFAKFEFRAINYPEDRKLKNTLIISADEPIDKSAVIHTVSNPAGDTMYNFIATHEN